MTSAHRSALRPAVAPDDGPAMTITDFGHRCEICGTDPFVHVAMPIHGADR
jgi:hypothetical protein